MAAHKYFTLGWIIFSYSIIFIYNIIYANVVVPTTYKIAVFAYSASKYPTRPTTHVIYMGKYHIITTGGDCPSVISE